jgi:hypothetical protein
MQQSGANGFAPLYRAVAQAVRRNPWIITTSPENGAQQRQFGVRGACCGRILAVGSAPFGIARIRLLPPSMLRFI